MADLKDFDIIAGANEGYDLPLINPTTRAPLTFDLKPEQKEEDVEIMTIKIRGADSDEVRKVQRNNSNRRRQMAVRSGRGLTLGTAEQDEADRIAALVAATIGWSIQLNGEKPPFSAKAAAALYTKYPWIARQVEDAISDDANFLKSAS